MSQIASPIGETIPGLREYLAVLWLRKWWVVLGAGLSVATALVLTIKQTPTYLSETRVLVEAVNLFPGDAGSIAKINMETEQQLAKSPAVAALAAAKLNGPTADELLKHVTVATQQDTEILVIGYVDPSARAAQLRAQAFASAYLDFRQTSALNSLDAAREPLKLSIDSLNSDLQRVTQQLRRTSDPNEIQQLQFQSDTLVRQIADLTTQLNQLIPEDQLRVGQVVAPAEVPGSPASPKYPLTLALALMLGLALGVGSAFVRDRLDERIRGMADLEANVGAPVLAAIPRSTALRSAYQGVMASRADRDPAVVEAYRTLRAGLLIAAARSGAKVILVTSAHPSEGKTSTTANLAAVLAQSGKRVVAVSADYRRPRLHRFFAIADAPGLTEVLTGSVSLRDALAPSVIPNLSIVPSGNAPSNADELLGTEALFRLIGELRKSSDIILIDVAPVLGVADAVTLAPATDGALFVVDAERTTRRAVGRARQQLAQVNAPILGAVLNKFRPGRERTYPYYVAMPPGGFTGSSPTIEPNGRRPVRGSRVREIEADRSPPTPGEWQP
jgi:capsular exopolysaccharide synthesis family protein